MIRGGARVANLAKHGRNKTCLGPLDKSRACLFVKKDGWKPKEKKKVVKKGKCVFLIIEVKY